MFTNVVVSAFVLFAIMLLVFAFIDKKNTQAVKARHKALSDLSNDIRSRYRVDVLNLCENYHLPEDTRSKLLAIAGNYFVYQNINSKSVENLAYNLDKLSGYFAKLQVERLEQEDSSALLQKIENFTQMLPNQARGYDADFYISKLVAYSTLLDVDSLTKPQQNSSPEISNSNDQQSASES